MIPGTDGIYLTAEENPGKLQLGDRLVKAVRPVIASNGVPCLQMKSLEYFIILISMESLAVAK